jgi:hypothetical protein
MANLRQSAQKAADCKLPFTAPQRYQQHPSKVASVLRMAQVNVDIFIFIIFLTWYDNLWVIGFAWYFVFFLDFPGLTRMNI